MKKYLLNSILALFAFALVLSSAEAQKKFTYADISKGLFSAKGVSGLRSMNDGENYTIQKDGKIIKFNYKTGQEVEVIFDAAKMPEKFNFSGYTFSGDEKQIMFSTEIEPIYRHSNRASNYIYNIDTKQLVKLSNDGKQQVATFSPDGTKVAYVRDNNLYWYDVATAKTTQITSDGRFNYILNGIPDWVYEEEYGFARAFEWAPSSDAIAYYRTDEERVKEYHMNMFNNKLYPTVYSFKYPKAGEQNSLVTINVYNLNSQKTTKMDIGKETDIYIPRIKWATNDNLIIFRLNRLQNNLDLLLCNVNSGESKIVYNEVENQYIERVDNQTITFLNDGDRFIIMSERDGNMHLYLYSLKKGFLNTITAGNWEVTSMLGIDEKSSLVYFMSNETSPLRRNLYSIKLNGKDKKRITTLDGSYGINFSKGYKYFISNFSNATTPATVTLHTSDGKLVRTLEDNAKLKAIIADYKVPTKEFFTFKTPEGVELYGYMIKPTDFDPNKEYPLFMTQYSGPGSQSVADNFGMSWEHALVQEGYILACVDGRGTGFRGEDFKKVTYKNLGHYEVLDQIEAAKYLGSQKYIDASRIMIYGWSYGGFMALNCILKGGDVFKAAIAVAPVTSWRYYDTIYTEIYNGLPQDNPDGYDKNSPIHFADQLKGKLLLAHGTGDDNVHIQNSYEMINALVSKGKDFEMYMIPDKNHGMSPGRVYYNTLIEKCLDFVRKNL